MLESIHIKNLALIREAHLDLHDDLNILSGETGAGKSILLGSVSLALGGRTDPDLIRTGADHAFVELVFRIDSEEVLSALREMDVYPEEGRIVIQRRILPDKSVSRINGETVTLALLRRVSALLIDIHGQHEHQSLLNEDNHLKVLDAYGRDALSDVQSAYVSAYRAYRAKRADLQAMGGADDESRKRELDFLVFEISEIEEARLQPGEEADLQEERKKLVHAHEIGEALGEAGDQLENQASEALSRAIRSVGAAVTYDPSLSGIQSQLSLLDGLLQDALKDVDARLSENEPDDGRLQEVEDRLLAIDRLKRKYGSSEAEILKKCDEFRVRRDELLAFEENRDRILEELDRLRHELIEAADRLHEVRTAVGHSFEKAITASLTDLNFLDVRFETVIEKGSRFTPDGADHVSFRISANPGEPMKPLSKVASGGELSRIMLAIRALNADSDRIGTLIFDEIDTGISGRTGKAVGEKMAEIAKNRQVICISHLPQIVAMADHHYFIEKMAVDGSTETRIRELDEEESLRELARLLGAGYVTAGSLENAREMKASAGKQRK